MTKPRAADDFKTIAEARLVIKAAEVRAQIEQEVAKYLIPPMLRRNPADLVGSPNTRGASSG
jgi:hypothetical protein